ncbi:MAG: glycosyltransferase family 2 protein [Bacteroidaceae bacterium]|nr:glycosyltransferase family 2 protein [Bacteroidaceae bacterium]
MIYTIVMPTFNSGRTIEKSLKSIREQDFDQSEVEILVIDGGSTDDTLEIAAKYDATIMENPKRLPEFAKKQGFAAAKGRYCMFLDSDEILDSMDCLKRRQQVFENHPKVKNINSTGAPAPKTATGVNRYSTRVAEPFSNFVYHFYNGDHYVKTMVKEFPFEKIKEDGFIFHYEHAQYYPLFDGQGNTFDISYARQLQAELGVDDITTDIFCTLVSKTGVSAILEDDFCIHDQNMSAKTYLRKIKWKIKNNLFANECVGYSSRAKTQGHLSKRRLLFIPFCLTLIPVIINAVRLAVTEKDLYFLMDIFFTEATFVMICFYMALKLLHVPVKMDKSYGRG